MKEEGQSDLEHGVFAEIQLALEQNKFLEIRRLLIEENDVDIAQFLEELEGDIRILRIFRLLPKDRAAAVFSYLPSELQMQIIDGVTDMELKNIIDELFLDDAIDLIEEMPAGVVTRVLQNANEETRTLINRFLQYPENSAGSIMTIEYVDLRRSMTVGEAIERVRRTAVDKETIYTCFVVDEKNKLEGVVSVRSMLLNDDKTLIDDLYEDNPVYVATTDDQETVSNTFRKYDLLSMPVVDNEKRLVGIITIDDVVDVITEESTEDFEKLAAIVPSETPYLKTGVLQLAANRIVWLIVLMLLATLTQIIILANPANIVAQVLLLSFIPMLMSVSGSAGNQASTLIVRGIALEEITPGDIWGIIWRELGVSLIVGSILAIITFARIWLFRPENVAIALTVSLSLILTIALAKVIGAVLPILAVKLKIDPAIMAAPLISTIIDVCSLAAYFAVARAVLY